MKLATLPYTPAAVPVHWLAGESSLRAYLAQRDHFLQLHCRALAPRPYPHSREIEPPVERQGEDIALTLH